MDASAPGIRGVIEQLIDTEGQARQLVAEAETEARETVVRARDEARQIGETARSEANEAVQRQLEESVAQAQKTREERISKAVAEDAAAVERSREKLPKAAALLVRHVLGQESESDA